MRMVLVGPRPPLRGGIAAHTTALEKQLEARGHEVFRVGFSRLYPPGLFPGRSELLPDPQPQAATDDLLVDPLNPFGWSAVERAIEATHCDRLIVQWWHPFFSSLIKRLTAGAKAPVVAVCHNAKPHDLYPGWRRATRRALTAADLLLCHSQAVSDVFGRMLPQLPRRVVPMPLLVPLAGEIGREDARRRLGIRRNGRLVLFAGHARRYKGIDVLLAAWDKAQLPNMAGLVIAGESYLGGDRLKVAAARCRRSSSIRVIDRYLSDDELAAWLGAADVLVLPYVRASQSGLLGAAVAAGTEVIATSTGGLGEQADATGALVVEPGSVEELARAMSTVLGRSRAGEAGNAMQHAGASAGPDAAVEMAIACESARRRE
jgi:D-inositol-3-phosphate glycosyltransferase